MCAKILKVRRDARPQDAPLAAHPLGSIPRTEVQPDGGIDDEVAHRILRNKMTWKEWLLYDFLRYWYGLGALALVVFSVSYISWRYHVRDPGGLAALAIGGFALVVLEFLLYMAIWPKGMFTQGWPAGRRLRMAIMRLRWRM